MARIVIGKQVGGREAAFDLGVLLRTRLLLQANSGGGKSWALRRLAEQLFGKVPVIIIDPEGEFATLREKFGYVLVGQGGETPTDLRSAKLVAERLLQLHASAVCDLYELKKPDRHAWVRTFLDTLMDAPKSLWQNLVVIVDEAHVFCPEKGKGESEASGSIIDLATRGRKRGYCAVLATQRLGKLNKDASAELLNRLIGPTFEDLDIDRAIELLSVGRDEKHDFAKQLKMLDPGHFHGLGRAISKERILIAVGSVLTTHPEAGSSKHSMKTPPAPEKVKALLPKLADLPKEAEARAKTEAELRTEIRSLKTQLAVAEIRSVPPAKETVRVTEKLLEVPVIENKQIRRIEGMLKVLNSLQGRFDKLQDKVMAVQGKVKDVVDSTRQMVGSLSTMAQSALTRKIVEPVRPPIRPPLRDRSPMSETERTVRSVETVAVEARADNGDLLPKQIAILKAIAEFEALNQPTPSKTWVAALSGASHRSSAYKNNLGALRTKGYLEYVGDGLRLTDQGREIVGPVSRPVTEEAIFERCLRILKPKQAAILRAAHAAWPNEIDRDELARQSGASPTSSAYKNNLGALRSAGMIEYSGSNAVRCRDWMFPDRVATR